MTIKDKTGDRLVASIRRTKAGAEKAAEDAAVPAAPPAKTATAPAKKSTAQSAVVAGDNYQSGGRVWPD